MYYILYISIYLYCRCAKCILKSGMYAELTCYKYELTLQLGQTSCPQSRCSWRRCRARWRPQSRTHTANDPEHHDWQDSVEGIIVIYSTRMNVWPLW